MIYELLIILVTSIPGTWWDSTQASRASYAVQADCQREAEAYNREHLAFEPGSVSPLVYSFAVCEERAKEKGE